MLGPVHFSEPSYTSNAQVWIHWLDQRFDFAICFSRHICQGQIQKGIHLARKRTTNAKLLNLHQDPEDMIWGIYHIRLKKRSVKNKICSMPLCGCQKPIHLAFMETKLGVNWSIRGLLYCCLVHSGHVPGSKADLQNGMNKCHFIIVEIETCWIWRNTLHPQSLT